MKKLGQVLRAALCGVLACAALQAFADAGSERARYAELQAELKSSNAFNRALHIDSVESGDVLKGDVFALLDHPFSMVSTSLKEPAQWCDILILPFNTKYCHAVDAGGSPALLVRIGRKFDQPVQNAYRIQFGYRNVAQSAEYFEIRLDAASGPVGTKDYRIIVSAIPVDGGKTFLHLSYSYGYGMTGRIAMQAYLGTVGADKIGFTVTGRGPNGQPQFDTMLGAGGNAFPGPWGTSVSANLTPTGLSGYTDDQLKAIISKGVRPDGSHLLPPMGVAYYANLTANDLDAIVLYLRGLPAKDMPKQ